MLKLKAKDKVKILSGKDKGREAEIERVDHKAGKLIIPGINMYKKHIKGSQGQKGGIYDIPRPVGFGKVALMCPNCKKAVRVGIRFAGEEKIRYCKKCNKQIDKK